MDLYNALVLGSTTEMVQIWWLPAGGVSSLGWGGVRYHLQIRLIIRFSSAVETAHGVKLLAFWRIGICTYTICDSLTYWHFNLLTFQHFNILAFRYFDICEVCCNVTTLCTRQAHGLNCILNCWESRAYLRWSKCARHYAKIFCIINYPCTIFVKPKVSCTHQLSYSPLFLICP